jgi:hypothetical protein
MFTQPSLGKEAMADFNYYERVNMENKEKETNPTLKELQEYFQRLEDQIPKQIIKTCEQILQKSRKCLCNFEIGEYGEYVRILEIHKPINKEDYPNYWQWFKGARRKGDIMENGEAIHTLKMSDELKLLEKLEILREERKKQNTELSAQRGNIIVMTDRVTFDQIVLKLPPSLSGHLPLLQDLTHTIPLELTSLIEKHKKKFIVSRVNAGIPEAPEDDVYVEDTVEIELV